MVTAGDDEVTLVAPLQPVKGDALAAAIDGIWPGGSTDLSDGWLKGVEGLGRSSGDGRRAVVLLTDGWPTSASPIPTGSLKWRAAPRRRTR